MTDQNERLLPSSRMPVTVEHPASALTAVDPAAVPADPGSEGGPEDLRDFGHSATWPSVGAASGADADAPARTATFEDATRFTGATAFPEVPESTTEGRVIDLRETAPATSGRASRRGRRRADRSAAVPPSYASGSPAMNPSLDDLFRADEPGNESTGPGAVAPLGVSAESINSTAGNSATGNSATVDSASSNSVADHGARQPVLSATDARSLSQDPHATGPMPAPVHLGAAAQPVHAGEPAASARPVRATEPERAAKPNATAKNGASPSASASVSEQQETPARAATPLPAEPVRRPGRTADEIERDIEASRLRLALTIDAINERVQPSNVAARAKDRARALVVDESGNLRMERVAPAAGAVLALVALIIYRRRSGS